jgi:hypothetical protein
MVAKDIALFSASDEAVKISRCVNKARQLVFGSKDGTHG